MLWWEYCDVPGNKCEREGVPLTFTSLLQPEQCGTINPILSAAAIQFLHQLDLKGYKSVFHFWQTDRQTSPDHKYFNNRPCWHGTVITLCWSLVTTLRLLWGKMVETAGRLIIMFVLFRRQHIKIFSGYKGRHWCINNGLMHFINNYCNFLKLSQGWKGPGLLVTNPPVTTSTLYS